MRTVNGVTIAPDAWQNYAKLAQAVTPSDSTPLPDVTRYVYVGGTGNLTVIFADDASQTPVTFTAVPTGALLPIAVSQVKATGTTATGVLALF